MDNTSTIKIHSVEFGAQNAKSKSVVLDKKKVILHPYLDICCFIFSGPESGISICCYKNYSTNYDHITNGRRAVLFGFPVARNRKAFIENSISSEPLILEIDTLRLDKSEIVFKFDRSEFARSNYSDIEKKKLPKGMSGSGIFLIPKEAQRFHCMPKFPA